MFQEEDRASPIAFTVDFGGNNNLEGKQKKLEKFALRSSQRTPGSPKRNTKVENEADKERKTRAKTKAMMAMGEPCRDEVRHMAQHGANPFLLRQKSDLARENVSPARNTNRSHGEEGTKVSSEIEKDNQGGEAGRKDAKTALALSRKGMVKQRQEQDEVNYNEDTFDSDDNEDDVNGRPESDPSETGTYTVDKDEEIQGFQVHINKIKDINYKRIFRSNAQILIFGNCSWCNSLMKI